ncbi:MAG: hypothetical protein ACRDRM_07475 [Pseudonocardiaceae bacterium]
MTGSVPAETRTSQAFPRWTTLPRNGPHRHGLIDDARHAEVLGQLGAEPPAADPAGDPPTWQLRRLVLLIEALGNPPLTVAERASLIVTARQDQATVMPPLQGHRQALVGEVLPALPVVQGNRPTDPGRTAALAGCSRAQSMRERPR